MTLRALLAHQVVPGLDEWRCFWAKIVVGLTDDSSGL